MNRFGKRYTLQAAAKELGISEDRLRRLARQRKIAHRRTGDARIVHRVSSTGDHVRFTRAGNYEFFQADLDAYLAGGRIEAVQPRNAPPSPDTADVDASVRTLMPARRRLG